ncbi:Rpn family recombination-promoting nuclease/putative transposase [Pedobacter metabolipauper]|uniref:Putative transposase/invertase (TIGR01784 family) n=1 Tax=Pedobacter metabolipauper TaxID=425513 RepID=A0A4R6SRF6_9SPHI|nr:Rpn family recombination-promoting nuclease/putative transposase [Pedobacter metabolipauper]TDQ06182.1 putative transposase/invertase (TIGR01784 family) [Pedobacter metabolipauper]
MKNQPRPAIPLIPEYIDPYSDFGFKHYFGKELNKDLLIDFLNSILEGHKVIYDLQYGNSERRGPQHKYRKTLFDLYCTGTNGEEFIIEMQRAKPLYFKDRSIFYTSALIQEQGISVKPGWNYLLPEVYLIAIMDFCFEDSPAEQYLHRVMLTDIDTKQVFYNKLTYIYVEMPKFRKKINELETAQDKWLFMLNNLNKMERIPVSLVKKEFVKLFSIAKVGGLNPEEMTEYQRFLKVERDNYSVAEAYKLEGELKGIIEGELEGKLEIAVKLKTEGMPDSKIAEITGFSITKIEGLKIN